MNFGNPAQTAPGVIGLLDITGNGAPEVAVLPTRSDGIATLLGVAVTTAVPTRAAVSKARKGLSQ